MRRMMTVGLMVLCFGMSFVTFAVDDAKPVTDRWYRWSLRGEPAGWFHAGCFHVVQKETGDKDAPVLLEHEFVVNWKGKHISLAMQTTCLDDEYLSPVKIVSKGEGDEEMKSFTATIERKKDGTGKLKAVVGGRGVEMDIPAKTVEGFAVFEIVRKLPFERKKPFEFTMLEGTELNLKPGHEIVYDGQGEIAIDGEKKMLHRFDHTQRGRVRTQFWVDEKHELIRVVMDGHKEYVLTTEEKAKAALKD